MFPGYFLLNIFECSLHHYKLKFIVINSYEHFKLIWFSPQFNSVELLRTHFLQTFLYPVRVEDF